MVFLKRVRFLFGSKIALLRYSSMIVDPKLNETDILKSVIVREILRLSRLAADNIKVLPPPIK